MFKCWKCVIRFVSFPYTCKKSLKIPKRSSESVNRRRTDNTMAKRKRTNNDLQNTHIKLKFKLDEPH